MEPVGRTPGRHERGVARPVRVRDVAAAAGVSSATVSNVLNNPERVTPRTVARVNAAIDALGFVRNGVARQLRAGRSQVLGLIVADVRNPFFTEIARGAEDRALESGFSLLLANADDDPSRARRYLDLFAEQRVHGVLVAPVGDVAQRLRGLRERGTPSVVIDHRVEDLSISSVSVDDVEGGRIAVSHLLERGHRRIAYLTAPLGVGQVQDRLAGALSAVRSIAGATLEAIEVGALSSAEGAVIGRTLAARPVNARPEAVFAPNDLLGLGVIQGLLAGGLDVPGDIAVVGYDDIPFAGSAVVAMSSVRQPSALMGARAVELLLAETASGFEFEREAVVYVPELVVRRSSEASRAHRIM